MTAAIVVLTVLAIATAVALRVEWMERRGRRTARLNRESWEVLLAARRIHDETAAALKALFDEAEAGRR